MRALLALPFVLLAACGEDAKSPSPEAPGNKADQGGPPEDRLGAEKALGRKLDEIENRSKKPLTDAEVETYVAVYPEFVAARADPAALRAVLVKHDTDIITWSRVAARVIAAYEMIKTGKDVPLVVAGKEVPLSVKGDVDVVRKHLDAVEKAMKSAPK